jgi:late competence protein required for DNA uptake (superfamily II DNA/RNA helicase)
VDERVERLFGQMAAFNEVTVECDRCHTGAALDLLRPTAHGLYCRRCLIEMPTFEYDALRADGRALEAEFSG